MYEHIFPISMLHSILWHMKLINCIKCIISGGIYSNVSGARGIVGKYYFRMVVPACTLSAGAVMVAKVTK